MTLAVETAAPERMQRRELSERAFAWALIAPALLFIAVIVVWPLAETIRLMGEIDAVIDVNEGWPIDKMR